MATGCSSPELVGRTDELVTLEAAFERASAGSPAMVLVAGDSGVGKSRLVAEFAARAEGAGARVLVGECVELSDGEIPFAPVISALRHLARGLDEGESEAILGPVGDGLARLFPELAPPSVGPVELLDPGAIGQARLFELLLGVLERLGEQWPAVLVIEDLHWSDRSTRDFLLFLARSLRNERLAILITYRSDELHRRHPLRPFLVQIEGAQVVERIDLRPLSQEQVAAQLDGILGEQPTAALTEAIYRRSEGNPFFTEELLAVSSGAATGGLPETLRDALLLRTEALSPTAQEVIRIAAAAGRRVQHGLLAAVAGLPEADLLHGLREAVSHHVLVEAGDDGSYEFRHALLREAVYSDLLPGERGKSHVALAEAIEAEPELAGPGTIVSAELAYHWYAAHELGCALRTSADAGLESERIFAFAEAQHHLERALEIWDRVPADADGKAGLDRFEIIRRAASNAHRAGDGDRAIALGRLLVSELDPVADAEAAAMALERLGRYLWTEGRGGEALPVYRQAVATLPDEPSAALAQALAALAQALMLSDQPCEATELCDRALPIARAVGARRVEANIVNTLIASSGSYTGDTQAALDWMEQGRVLAEELRLPDELLRSYANGSEALEQAGRVEEALQVALDGAERAREWGLERHSGHFLQAVAAIRLMRLGRWDEATDLADGVVAAGTQRIALIIARTARAEIALGRGDFELGRALLDATGPIMRHGGSIFIAQWRSPFAWLALREGRLEEAREIVGEVFASLVDDEYVFSTAPVYWLGVRVEADIAERARPLRDAQALADAEERALALIARVDPLLAAFREHPAPPAALAFRAAMTGELERLRGNADPALWAVAAERFDAIGQIAEGAYSRFRQAEALVRGRASRDDASAVLAEARDVAGRLGMKPLLADIDGLARRARLRVAEAQAEPPAAEPDAAVANLGLTEREREVLALVAEGLTNREIGERLFMSEKTASVHVSRILSKLGAANRAEAAASAQRLGLVGT